jgi:hypothetical protein
VRSTRSGKDWPASASHSTIVVITR